MLEPTKHYSNSKGVNQKDNFRASSIKIPTKKLFAPKNCSNKNKYYMQALEYDYCWGLYCALDTDFI